MSTAPLLVALQNQDVLQRISLELNAVGRDFTIVTNSSELVQSISGATDVIVEALLDLGASDVFGVQTSARVVVARLGSARPTLGGPGAASNVTLPELMLVEGVAAREGMHGENGGLQSILTSSLNEDCEPAGVLPAEALEGFTERVAIFCASVRGLNVPNPKREIQGLLETVLEELDSTQEMSYSASRLAVVAMGDDLYAILVPDIERVQDAARLGVRLHEAVSTTSGVMAHIGIACSPDDGTGASELIEHAQDAVLRARQAGENNIEFYSESMSRWAFERLTLEQSLRDALRNRELVVYYQPRIDIETRKILGMEALVRWIHPQFGLVSPGQFIPLAEETGLIIPIGEWILRDACRQNAAWRAMGLPPIRVSVNLSPVQFRKPNLHESVYDALDDAGLEADGLELEVTESLLMNDPAETASILGKLKSRGIHISIDDFGTGYSSLSYLKRFPINALKIDRSFISDVTTNPDDAAITTAIILMGHSLKLSVVAEGVETENQLAFLKVLQCNEVQGFLFSPPVPAERAQEMLADQQFAKAAA